MGREATCQLFLKVVVGRTTSLCDCMMSVIEFLDSLFSFFFFSPGNWLINEWNLHYKRKKILSW